MYMGFSLITEALASFEAIPLKTLSNMKVPLQHLFSRWVLPLNFPELSI